MKSVSNSDFEKIVKYYNDNPSVISARYIGVSDLLTFHNEDEQIDPLYIANKVIDGGINKTPSEIRDYYNGMVNRKEFIKLDSWGVSKLNAWMDNRYKDWLKPANFGVNVVVMFKLLRDQWFIDRYLNSEQYKKAKEDLKNSKIFLFYWAIVNLIAALSCMGGMILYGFSIIPTIVGIVCSLSFVVSLKFRVCNNRILTALKGLTDKGWYNIDYRYPVKDKYTCKILSDIENAGVVDLTVNNHSYEVITKVNKLAREAINYCLMYDLIVLSELHHGRSDLCAPLGYSTYDSSKYTDNALEISNWLDSQIDKRFVPAEYNEDIEYEPRTVKDCEDTNADKLSTTEVKADDLSEFKRNILEFKNSLECVHIEVVQDYDIMNKINKIEVLRYDESVSDIDKQKIDSFVRRYGTITKEFVGSLKTLKAEDKHDMAKEFLSTMSSGADALISKCNSNNQLDCSIQLEVLRSVLKLDGLSGDSDDSMKLAN